MKNIKQKNLVIKFISFIVAPALLFASLGLSGCTSCSAIFESVVNNKNQIVVGEYPNEVAQNAQISDEYENGASSLTTSAFSYFREICSISRKSESMDAISDYILNFATSHSFTTIKDNAGNICFDIPATTGYESYPKVIMQAHLDMTVNTKGDAETSNSSNEAITLMEDEESFTSDEKTSLGADDGAGICTLLAIASADSNTCSHGPLRMLFTVDKENNLAGASNIENKMIDSEYLINVDGDYVGQVAYCSAGAVEAQFSQNIRLQNIPEDYTAINVEINGLRGGHSSLHSFKKLLSSSNIIKTCMQSVNDTATKWFLISLESGESNDTIPTAAKMQFCVPSSEYEDVIDKIKKDSNNLINEYSDENNVSLTCVKTVVSSDTQVIPNLTSKYIYEMVNALPDGSIDTSEDSQTSCNLSPIIVKDGKSSITAYYRSLSEQSLEDIQHEFSKLASINGFTYSKITEIQPWKQDSDNKFTTLYIDSLKKTCGLEGVKSKSANVLETSVFSSKNTSLNIISCGADINNKHLTSETFYKNSYKTHIATILSILKNIKDLN